MTEAPDSTTVAESTGHDEGHRRRDEESPDHERGPDNHLALVYDSFDEQLAAVVPFVRQGLERGERVCYIVDQNTEAEMRDAFRAAGIDVDAHLDSGALVFQSKADTYERFDEFDADLMIEQLAETIRETVADGEYDRLRITGEMTWALDADADTLEAVVEYESKLNEFFPEQPITAVCQYDRTKFPPEVLYDIIRAHPHQVYNATVCQNFAYLPPEEFFAAAPPTVEADRAIDAHLDRLRTQSTLERREETLSALATSSQNLLEGGTEEVLDQAVRTVQQVLDPSLVAVFGYDEVDDELVPEAVALGGDATDPASVSLPTGYREFLWEAFVADETTVFENFQDGAALPGLGAVLQSGMVLPVDHHGVVLVASTQAYAYDEGDVQFVSTVATTTSAALARVDRERTLEEQNEQLQYISRLNRVIRRIDQAVIRASTREEVERAVCEQLTDTDFYRFAWVGGRDPLGETFTVSEWAGEGEQYLNDLRVRRSGRSADADAGTGSDPGSDAGAGGQSGSVVNGPERTALRSGEAQVVPNALTETMFGEWRRAALDAGFRSCISVPLRQDDAEYGVLNIYAGQPGTFTGMEREVLTELGATIAFAIDAAETRVGVHAERSTELRLRVAEGSPWLLRLARQVGGRLDVETVLPGEGDRVRLFFTAADADPAAVLAAAEESVTVETVRHIADHDDGALFETVVTGGTLAGAVASRKAATTHLSADEHGVTLLVELPGTRNPRAFVQSLAEEYPGVTVESIRRVNQPLQTRQSFYSTLEDELTTKQLEALEVAYHSGYFEWPRESAGRDIAASLGISQPTFSGHLRAGQRKLFRELFDS